MRRFGDWPKDGQTYTRRPGVYAILPLDGGLLATFQGAQHQEYQLPGGGIDAGEHPIAALHREVLEETGWIITAPKFFYRFKRYTFMPEYNLWAEKICTIYTALPVRCLGPAREADHTAIHLEAETAISQLAVSGDRFAVSRYFGMPL